MNFGVLVSFCFFFDDCVGCFDFSGVDDECEIEYFLRTALGASYKERKSRWRARHFYGSNRQEEGEAHSWRYSNNNNRG